MNDVTQILLQIERGDPGGDEQLLPLVYQELRKLAAAKLAKEKPGQTLQATALVHDAYIRLVDVEKAQHWDSRGHFFAAAAEAMRRILVERARSRMSKKRGGDRLRVDIRHHLADVASPDDPLATMVLDDALTALESVDPRAAQVVKLRVYAGLNLREVAAALGTSLRTAERNWAYARAWLHGNLSDD